MIYVCPWCEAMLGRDKDAALAHESDCDIGPDLDMGLGSDE